MTCYVMPGWLMDAARRADAYVDRYPNAARATAEHILERLPVDDPGIVRRRNLTLIEAVRDTWSSGRPPKTSTVHGSGAR